MVEPISERKDFKLTVLIDDDNAQASLLAKMLVEIGMGNFASDVTQQRQASPAAVNHPVDAIVGRLHLFKLHFLSNDKTSHSIG